MSTAITLPVLGLGVAVTKTAADFETAMNRVSISTGAAGDTFRQLSDLAREIGRETVFSASTAADAIDMLAKSGVSVEDILGGAARAAVDLAAAAGTELDPAAAAITDSMAQFKLTVQDLPRIVNGITGAVNESKLDFGDFTLAIGQAGGVAANLGVTFEDFNTVLAATSPLFASGSDAGTSFKTFLQRMVPTTKQAAAMMERYGLTFHDATGAMRPMADIAQMLQDKLGGLSDKAKTEVLSRIFGTDSMRTAIALMDQGAAGLDNIAARIEATDAAAQSAKRMEGLAGQLEQLGGAFEEVAIAIGNSGLLDLVTKVVRALAEGLERVAAFSPQVLQFGMIFAGLAAAIGPVLIVVGQMVSAWGTLMAAFGGTGVLASIVPLLGPIGIAVAAVAAAFLIWGDQVIPALKAFGSAVIEAVGPTIMPVIEAAKTAFVEFGRLIGQLLGGESGDVVPALRFFGQIVGEVFAGVMEVVRGLFEALGHVFRAIGALLRGDWSTMWNALGSAVASVLGGIWRAFETVAPKTVEAMRRLYDGVKTWLQDRLGSILNWVSNKAKEVGDAFFTLYDRVVGNSYVPDMVEEIGQWMGKLQETLVDPAEKATKRAGDAFADLQRRVQGIMRDLLTDREKLVLEFRKESSDLDEAERSGRFDPQFLAEARRRLNAKFAEDSAGLDAEGLSIRPLSRLTPIGDNPGIQRLNEAMERMKKAIHDAREDFADSFAWGMESALRGDWKGLLEGLLGDAFRNGLKDIGRSLFDRSGSGAGGFNLGSIGKTIGSFFSRIPGFSTGGSFKVGGAGGIDSKLVSMRLTPGEMVNVRRPGEDLGPTGATYVIQGNLLTPEFWRQIQAETGGAENRAYGRSMADAPKLTMSQTAKQQASAVGRKRR
ncbi:MULTISPECIES: phage tail tape measure protein [unclassified Brevundimonas]|uniref:phage tail tape measure protein n=2 Tax=unclassified Brevundimonas TaxID=2622653 RepID=UPI001FD845D1|nr:MULTISPECIES: phage tail tape measure protein [unclassified Brevundimonas]